MADEEKLLQAHTSPEHKGHFEVADEAGEQLKKIEKSKNSETKEANASAEQKEAVEHARKAVEQEAVSSSQESEHENTSATKPETERQTGVSKEGKQMEYEKTMHSIQSQVSKPSQSFSKIIHRPVIETTSQIIGESIARPNAILTGSISALITVSGLYILANYNGFQLSGFETIGAFAIGWLLGMLLDLLGIIFRRKRTF